LLVLAFVSGRLERGAAQAADGRAVFDLPGRELNAARLGQTGARGGYPSAATFGRFARVALALVLTPAAGSIGPRWARQVDQEGEAGAINRGGHLGLGVERWLAGKGAVGPTGDLVRHVRPAVSGIRKGDSYDNRRDGPGNLDPARPARLGGSTLSFLAGEPRRSGRLGPAASCDC
jgi:hypothetical protein